MSLNGEKRVATAALFCVVLAALIAGCGGSSDAAPLKKPQFVKQANAICDSAQAERQALGKKFAGGGEGSGDSAEAEEVMGEILEPVETMTEQLAELGPPKGEEKEVEAIVSAFEAANAKLAAEPDGGNPVAAYDKANGLAAAYGLSSCSI